MSFAPQSDERNKHHFRPIFQALDQVAFHCKSIEIFHLINRNVIHILLLVLHHSNRCNIILCSRYTVVYNKLIYSML